MEPGNPEEEKRSGYWKKWYLWLLLFLLMQILFYSWLTFSFK